MYAPVRSKGSQMPEKTPRGPYRVMSRGFALALVLTLLLLIGMNSIASHFHFTEQWDYVKKVIYVVAFCSFVGWFSLWWHRHR